MKLEKITKWTVSEIAETAQKYSPYYQALYKEIKDFSALENLPIIDQNEFWKKEILTTNPHGMVFKSGGSTGNPKYSYFTHEEWESYTRIFGAGMAQGILSNGDKVANLFYGGDLYASFFFIKDSLQYASEAGISLTHFPIAGQTETMQILKTLDEFKIDVLCGVPSAIIACLEKYQENRSDFKNINLKKILYGGEGIYEDQEKYLRMLFPQIQIASIGCASVDGGPIGFSSRDCKHGEHRVFDEVTIIEIVDPETLEVIHEKNKIGKLILTNLTRKLMPIIRYPAGDMAMWLEDEGRPERKFKLCGRSDEAARLGTLSVYFEETRESILKLVGGETTQFQMLVEHFDHKDQLTLIVVGKESDEKRKLILDEFKKEKTSYEALLTKNLIHSLKVRFVNSSELEKNARTGKLKRIIDRR